MSLNWKKKPKTLLDFLKSDALGLKLGLKLFPIPNYQSKPLPFLGYNLFSKKKTRTCELGWTQGGAGLPSAAFECIA